MLIVDDDDVDRAAVRRALARSDVDAEYEEARGARAALDALRERVFDCVFLDYLLPDGDGLSVVKDLRRAGVRTPIIILTGQGDERIAVELMKAGASDYLPKSEVAPERLAHGLRNALRVHRAELAAQRAEDARARLFEMEKAARREAEDARRRVAFLAEASALLSASLDYETTLASVARLAVPHVADWCAIDVVDDDGWVSRVAVASRDAETPRAPDAVAVRYRPAADEAGLTSSVIRSGASEIVEDAADDAARSRRFADVLGVTPVSYMLVPLIARGRTVGAVALASEQPGRRFGAQDLSLVEDLARRAALAVDNARLYRDAKTAEAKLLHQLDFTNAITNHLAEGVVAFDDAGRVTFANPAAAALLGWRGDELVGRNAHELLRLDDVDPGSRAPTTIVRRDDATFLRRDGAAFPVSYSLSPLRVGGHVVGGVLAFHDLTDRKEAEREVEAARRHVEMSERLAALGTLVSGVAHEIRTPLTFIANSIFVARRRLESADAGGADPAAAAKEAAALLDAALEGVDRINGLVKDLRPFAHAEQGRRVEACLHEVVRSAVELFSVTQRGRVRVDVDLEPTPETPLHKGQIQSVVINLLNNAAEAMPSGGRVRVSTRTHGKLAVLEVDDSGPGLPPDVLEHAFEPFYTTKEDGTGLGLSITRRVVESHNGTIRVESSAGKGTRFIVQIPAPDGRGRGDDASSVATPAE